VAFGLMDQSVLIHAGDTIDSTLGVSLGLPTLGAAALGQVFSDTSGVLFGGTIDAISMKLGLPLPGLTDAQLRMGVVKRVATFGSVCGVITGCLLGMTNLLIVDLQATERAKKAEELKSIMKVVMEDGRHVVGCDRSTLWVVDDESEELWSSVANGIQGILRIPFSATSSLAGWSAYHKEVVNIPVVREDPRWCGAIGDGYVPQSMLVAPVIKGGRAIAVIQLLDKKDASGNIIPFDKNDEKLCMMLAGHARYFMDPDDPLDESTEEDKQSYVAWLKQTLWGAGAPAKEVARSE